MFHSKEMLRQEKNRNQCVATSYCHPPILHTRSRCQHKLASNMTFDTLIRCMYHRFRRKKISSSNHNRQHNCTILWKFSVIISIQMFISHTLNKTTHKIYLMWCQWHHLTVCWKTEWSSIELSLPFEMA